MPTSETPAWVGAMGPVRLDTFARLLREEFARHGGADLDLRQATATVERGGARLTLGLDNLAQSLLTLPEAEWPAAVRRHVEVSLSAEPLVEMGLEEAGPLLRLRFFPPGYAEQSPRSARRSLADGLDAHLVLDLPDSIRGVSLDQLERWGASLDQLWPAALEQTRREPLPAPELVERRDGVHLLESGSYYAASALLWLPELLPPGSEHGAVVAVPNRHVLLYHPIQKVRPLMGATRTLLDLAGRLHERGPGSISRGLYWTEGERVTALPARLDQGGVRFEPPQEFVDLMNRLP